ncbi:MAG: electron transport complex subunit E [Erysipelotrichaceae bacterium]|nr:electron transport complex subunit E [Erysipelotrichaceae bacterium]
MKKSQIFKNGITVENPIFVLLLGMCSALAITTSLTNAIGMGLAVTCVLILSNVIISLLRKVIPTEIRIPVYIVIIATLVKCVQLLMNAYMISLYNSLGVFIPLIVVNCIILGRAESFASKNSVLDSLIDALGMGLGYTLAILLVSFFRQLLGTGVISLLNPFDSTQIIFEIKLFADYAVSILTQPAGAFLTLGTIIGVINSISLAKAKKAKKAEVK